MLGEYVCWIVVGMDVVDSHDVLRDQLLDEVAFDVDVFCPPC